MVDFVYLEEVARVTDNAIRDNQQTAEASRANSAQLARAAAKLKINLLQMPVGMARQRANQSHATKGTVCWTVELDFAELDTKTLVHNVCHEGSVSSILKDALEVVPFAGQDLFVYLREDLATPVFHECNIDVRIGDVLTNRTIVEFPTLLVCTSSRF